MKNGYVYHTIYDNEQMIPAGSIQRAGMETLKNLITNDIEPHIQVITSYQW